MANTAVAVIWVRQRNQKSIARVRARSRFRRRPCLKDGGWLAEAKTGYPKNGFRIDVDDNHETGGGMGVLSRAGSWMINGDSSLCMVLS